MAAPVPVPNPPNPPKGFAVVVVVVVPAVDPKPVPNPPNPPVVPVGAVDELKLPKLNPELVVDVLAVPPRLKLGAVDDVPKAKPVPPKPAAMIQRK